MRRDDSIRNYCPGCGGNFEGNAGFCECSTGRQIQRLLASNKALRKFARYVVQQLGPKMPRTNGIDTQFCHDLGAMAAEALKVRGGK